MNYQKNINITERRFNVYTNGYEEIQVTPQQDQVYKALQTAAGRMGNNNYLVQKQNWLKKHKTMKNFRFTVTTEQQEVIQAMNDLLNNRITPEQAMSLLWQYDIMKQRLN